MAKRTPLKRKGDSGVKFFLWAIHKFSRLVSYHPFCELARIKIRRLWLIWKETLKVSFRIKNFFFFKNHLFNPWGFWSVTISEEDKTMWVYIVNDSALAD